MESDELLKERLEKSKKIREALEESGKYNLPIPWEQVESAMRFNHNEQERYKSD